MSARALLANAAWLASGLGATRRFHRGLRDPAGTQARVLQAILARDADSAFGRAHDLGGVRGWREFAARVPLASWEDHAPYIARVMRGERDVLSTGPVTHLATTSGSTGARKLVPFTPALHAAFDAAVSPWMHDLARVRPAIMGGPAYWSISPADAAGPEASAVPIGFADDAEYLGASKAWLVRALLAVPASIRHVRDERVFFTLTLLALLRRPDLRLLSVWHPSFLELLVAAAEPEWPLLLEAVASGGNPWQEALPVTARREWRAAPMPRRAAALRRIGPGAWTRWWPHLAVVSCWGEQAAEPGWHRLQRQCAGVLVQRKGLLATEAVVTVPIAGVLPLAITSHHFEFLDERGDVRLAHELEVGASYEVVVTTGGGLWRYRLGDWVACTGRLAATPALSFLGRGAAVSDLRGEKLSEVFVTQALGRVWDGVAMPDVARVRACDNGQRAGYVLVLPGGMAPSARDALADRLEAVLQENPHYAIARRLGQLEPMRAIAGDASMEQGDLRSHAGRLGDAKPRVLEVASPGVGAR